MPLILAVAIAEYTPAGTILLRITYLKTESPHLVGRPPPDAAGKARPTVNHLNPNNPLASKPPPAPPCQGECPVCPSPDKGRLGGVGVEFLPNGQSGIKRTVFFISNGYTIEKSFLTEAC